VLGQWVMAESLVGFQCRCTHYAHVQLSFRSIQPAGYTAQK